MKEKVKAVAVATVVNCTRDFKVIAILDKLPKEQRAAVVKVAGHKDGTIHRVFSDNKSVGLLPTPDLPRSATIYLSTRNVDADGDIVLPSGWDLSLYRGQGLWSHDYKADPIFKAIETGADDFGLWQLIQFADNERGNNYWNMVKDGYLRTFSAGIWCKANGAVEKNDRRFADLLSKAKAWNDATPGDIDRVQRFLVDKWLVESSLCNVPSNPFALVVAVNKGQIELCDAVKVAIGFDALQKKFVDAGACGTKTSVGAPVATASDTKTTDKATPPPTDATEPEDNDEDEQCTHVQADGTFADMAMCVTHMCDCEGMDEASAKAECTALFATKAKSTTPPADVTPPAPVKAKKSKDEYINADGTFKNGFDGCVLYMTESEGHDEAAAKKICGYIAQHTKVAPVAPFTKAVADVVTVIPSVRIVSAPDVDGMIESALKKRIAKARGAL